MKETKEQLRALIQATDDCERLWKWMEKGNNDSEEDKRDWPEWKRNGGNVENNAWICPICEYDEEYGCSSGECRGVCILSRIWPRGCLRRPSPFYSFYHGKGTSEDARKIWVEARRVKRNAVRRYERKRQYSIIHMRNMW